MTQPDQTKELLEALTIFRKYSPLHIDANGDVVVEKTIDLDEVDPEDMKRLIALGFFGDPGASA